MKRLKYLHRKYEKTLGHQSLQNSISETTKHMSFKKDDMQWQWSTSIPFAVDEIDCNEVFALLKTVTLARYF